MFPTPLAKATFEVLTLHWPAAPAPPTYPVPHSGIDCMLGSAPTHEQCIVGAILQAIYDCIETIFQLLMSGGSTQGLGFRIWFGSTGLGMVIERTNIRVG